MEIDYSATKQELHATGRTVAGWARCNGFNLSTVTAFLIGNYPITGDIGQQIIAALEKDGFLRHKEAA